MQMTVDEARAHAGGSLKAVPADIVDRIRDDLPHYLWVIDLEGGRERRIWCEWCGTLRDEKKRGGKWPQPLKQGETVNCPCCGGEADVKHIGRGFSGLRDRLDVIWYRKSAVDPEAIVAFGAFVDRDFCFADEERPWTLEPEIDVRSAAVMRCGAGGFRFKETVGGWTPVGGRCKAWQPTRKKWVPVKRFGPLTFGDTNGGLFFNLCRPPRVLYTDTLTDTIAGTPFERAWCGDYLRNDRGQDGTEALTWIARYPCVEYMTKLGMTEFLQDKLLHDLPKDAVNWRGQSMAAVLKLPKARLSQIKGAGIRITPALTITLRWMEARGYPMDIRQAENIAILADRYTSLKNIGERLEYALSYFAPQRRRKALKYMARTAAKIADARIHLGDFIDYWRQARNFEEDLNADAVAFPADLRAAEQRFADRRRREREAEDAKAREQLDADIAKRLKQLEKRFGFAFGGLILRPAKDSAEVIREGKTLHHCVGGYVRSYAEGHTVICVLRRAVQPDEPWRTVEIGVKTGKVVQDRGYRNDTKNFGIPLDERYSAALACFWEAWKERKTA